MRATAVFIAWGTAALLVMAGGRAGAADAHHELVERTPIKKGSQVIGFRATLVLHPEGWTETHTTYGGDVRLGLGLMKFSGQGDHREAAAGVRPGYIVHQLKMREITGPRPKNRGELVETINTNGDAKEVEIEVLYKDNPHLVPGTKMDLVAGFWKGSYWHIWGAADGPVTSSNEFVFKLPGTQSMRTLRTRASGLQNQRVTANAAEAAAKSRVDTADQAYAEAMVARQQGQSAHQAALDTYQQESQAAQLVLKLATHEAAATFRAADEVHSQAANQAYDARAKALDAADTKFYAAQAKVTPAQRTAYEQERQAIRQTYDQARAQAVSAYQAVQAHQPAQSAALQQAYADREKAVAIAETAYINANAAAMARYLPHRAAYDKERAQAYEDQKQTMASATQAYDAARTVYEQAIQGPQALVQKASSASQAKYQPARSAYDTLRSAELAKAADLRTTQAAMTAAQAAATEAAKHLSEVEAQVEKRQFLRRLKKTGRFHEWMAEQKKAAAAP